MRKGIFRFLFIILFLISFLFLAGCGNNTATDNKKDDTGEVPKEDDKPKEDDNPKEDESLFTYKDEFGNKRLSNGTKSEMIVVNKVNYDKYKNNLFGSAGKSGLVNSDLFNQDCKDISLDDDNYFIYLFYSAWTSQEYNEGISYLNTSFSSNLVSNLGNVSFDDEAIIPGSMTYNNFKVTSNDNKEIIPSKATVSYDMNKEVNSRLEISSKADTKYVFNHYEMFSIVIPFKVRENGELDINFKIEEYRLSSGYNYDNSYNYEKSINVIVGQNNNVDELVKINDYKISFIQASLCPDGVIDDTKLTTDPNLAINYASYMVVDIDLDVLVANSGDKFVNVVVVTTNPNELLSTIEDVPTSNQESVVENNRNKMKVGLNIAREASKKQYRLIYKLEPLDATDGEITVVLASDSLKLENHKKNIYYIRNLDNFIYGSKGMIVGVKNSNIVDLNVPASHNGYSVKISDNLFEGWDSLISINILAKSIGDRAFANCKNLKNVTVSPNCTDIASNAFDGCDASLFTEDNGLIYIGNDNNKYLVLLRAKEEKNSYSININTITMASGIFENNKKLTSINTFGIINVGKNSFKDCTNLTDVTLGYSAKYIGDYAFSGCQKLTNIKWQCDGLEIGDYVFNNCQQLTSFEIPSNVTKMGTAIFSGCSNLEKITLPFVGDGAHKTTDEYQYPFGYVFGTESFNNSTKITQKYYGEKAWVAYNSGYFYETKESEINYYIPTKLKEVVISGTAYIPYGAFSGCNTLTSIKITGNMTSVESKAFLNCSSLIEVQLSKNTETIAKGSFSGCGSLVRMTIPFVGNSRTKDTDFGSIFGTTSYTGSVEFEQNNYYYYVPTSLKEITIDGITSIKTHIFGDFTQIEKLTISDSVTHIYDYAFSGLKNLKSITLPFVGNYEYSDNLTYNFYNLFGSCDLVIENQKGEKFSIPGILEEVNITKAQGIPNYAFYNCSNIKSISIGKNVKTIGTKAFYGCSSIETCTVDANNRYFSSGPNNDCLIEKETSALLNGFNLTSIPTTVTAIGSYAYYNSSITSINIPDNIIKIDDYAFYGCSTLGTVTGCKGLKEIGEHSFESCLKLSQFSFNEGLETIGSNAFSSCYGFEEIVLPKSLKTINYAAFCRTSLKKISLPFVGKTRYSSTDTSYEPFGYIFGEASKTLSNAVLQYSGSHDFYYNIPSSLEEVVITDSEYIQNKAFMNCKIKSITLPTSLKSVGKDAFDNCSSLTKTSIANLEAWFNISFSSSKANPLGYSEALYVNDEIITSLVIPTSVTNINSFAFCGLTNLNTVILHSGVESISAGAFANCFRLVQVINKSNLNIELGSYSNGSVAAYAKIVTSDENASSIDTTDGFVLFKADDIVHLVDYVGTSSTVNIPSNVTSIGYKAFTNKANITNINISNSISEIDSYAFENCTSLNTLNIPNNVKNLGNGICAGCTNLKTLVLPDNLEKLDDNLFINCPNLIYNEYGNAKYVGSQNNDYLMLIKASSTEITSLDISTDCKYIANDAFKDCTLLTSLTIPNNIEYIGSGIIEGCNALTSLSIPFVGDRRHEETDYYQYPIGYFMGVGSDLTQYYYTDRLDQAEEKSFKILSYLKEVTITDSEVINYGAFYNYRYLESVTLSNGITKICSNVFRNCENLKNVTIGNNVTYIGENCFYNCKKIENVYISNLDKWCEIEYANAQATPLYYGKKLYLNNELVTELTIPTSVTKLGEREFMGLEDLTKVTLHDGITEIGDACFYNCTNLAEINLPSGLTQISASLFGECTSLVTLVIPDTVTMIGNFAFSNCTGLTSLEIPNSVTYIGYGAFNNCYSIKALAIPAFGLNGAKFGSIESVTVTSGDSIDSDVFENCSKLTTIVLPDTITTIKSGAFAFCTSLLDFDWPEELITIEKEAFYGCSSLTKVEMGNKVKTIGDYAFSNCTNLETIKLSSSIETMGKDVFNKADKITKAIIPSSVSFKNNQTIKEVEINSGTTIIEDAFRDCINLEKITISTNITAIDRSAFYNCESLTSLDIPSTVESIGVLAFYNCKSLKSIVIPDKVSSISLGLLGGCSSLESITLPFTGSKEYSSSDTYRYSFGYIFGTTSYDGSITIYQDYIGKTATEGLTAKYYVPKALKEVTLTNCKYLSYGAFSNCYNLTTINLPQNLSTIAVGAFTGCSALTSIEIPESITILDNSIFDGCTSLENVILSDNISTIRKSAFTNCKNIKYNEYDNGYYLGNANNPYLVLKEVKDRSVSSFTVNENTKVIADEACNGSEFEELHLPNCLLRIGNSAFSYCKKLTTLTIPNSVTFIGEEAFCQDMLLNNVIVGQGVETIQTKAFYNCTSLKEVYDLSNLNIQKGYTGNGHIGYYAIYIHKSLDEPSIIVKDAKGYTFAYAGETSYLISYDGDEEELVLPSSFEYNSNEITNYEISDNVFESKNITKVTIPSSVTKIGSYAFAYCEKLIELIVENDNISSLNYPFVDTKIETAKIPLSLLEKLPKTALTTLTLTGEGNITKEMFNSNTTITSIRLEGNFESIASQSFQGCIALENLTIPNSIKSVGASTFDGATSLIYNEKDSLSYLGNDTNPYLVLVKTNDTNITECVVEDNCKIIYSGALYSCTSLTKLVLPDTIQTISSETIYIHKLEEITVSASTLGVLKGTNLRTVNITSGTEIAASALRNLSRLHTVNLPDSITKIGSLAFSCCTALTSFVVPKNVKQIDNDAFYGCTALIEIYNLSNLELEIGSTTNGQIAYYAKAVHKSLDEPSIIVTDANGYKFFYSAEKSYFIGYSGSELELALPESFTYNGIEVTSYEIGEKALYQNTLITKVIMPDSIIGIGVSAFESCYRLAEVRLSNNITKISDNCFRNCNLQTITIPNSVTQIGKEAFYYNTELNNIVVSANLTTIGDSAFKNCTGLNIVYYLGTNPYTNKITSIAVGNAEFKNAIWYYLTSNKANETASGIWWYYDDEKNIVKLII